MNEIIIDASAVVDLLLGNDAGRAVADALETDGPVWSVAHMDAEVLSALGRLHRAGDLSTEQVETRLGFLGTLDVDRLPITGELLDAAWALRSNVSLRDGLYVAAATLLGHKVLTTDARLQRAAPDETLMPS